jgi:uncharacterized protein YeeX (DUF496 family)
MLKRTSTPSKIDPNDLLREREFEEFIRIHASDCYWKILAERARRQLEDQLRDNRQLHELLDELTKENEQLQMKNEQCEYLTNIFHSIISEYDNGIEMHIIDKSPGRKQAKIIVN